MKSASGLATSPTVIELAEATPLFYYTDRTVQDSFAPLFTKPSRPQPASMAEHAFPPSLDANDEVNLVFPMCRGSLWADHKVYIVSPTSPPRSCDSLVPSWQEDSTYGSADPFDHPSWNLTAADDKICPPFYPESSAFSILPGVDSEDRPSFQHCETCGSGSRFTGRYTRCNLARHKRLKHYRREHEDSDDERLHRCVSFDVHLPNEWGGTHSLEPLDRKDHPPCYRQDTKETTSRARTADSLHSPGKPDKARCCYALARIVHLRNVSRASHVATLRRLETVSTSESGKGNTIKMEPYGVIYIHKRSWYHVTLTVTCIIGQLASCLAMHNYERRHSVPTTQCIASATLTFFSDRLSRTWSTWEQNEVCTSPSTDLSLLTKTRLPSSSITRTRRPSSSFASDSFTALLRLCSTASTVGIHTNTYPYLLASQAGLSHWQRRHTWHVVMAPR
jgi:hypothetical protein